MVTELTTALRVYFSSWFEDASLEYLKRSLLRASKEESWFFLKKHVHPLTDHTCVALYMPVCMGIQGD